jgi:hypothetical protein
MQYFAERRIVQRARQVDAANLGAHHLRERLNIHVVPVA